MAKPVALQTQVPIGPGALSAAIAAAEAAVAVGLANFETAIASLQAVNPTEADRQALARLAGQSSALSRLAEIAGRQALAGRDQGEGKDG